MCISSCVVRSRCQLRCSFNCAGAEKNIHVHGMTSNRFAESLASRAVRMAEAECLRLLANRHIPLTFYDETTA